MSADSLEPVCGCMGCRRPKAATVEIPGKGTRAVCQQHLEDLDINGGTR